MPRGPLPPHSPCVTATAPDDRTETSMSDNINEPWGNTVLVEFDEHRIAWVRFNRPDKRHAMNPTLIREMLATLDHVEDDDRCAVVVLTGSDDAFSAGMDLK